MGLIIYALGLILICLLTRVVANRQYRAAQEKMKQYEAMLKRLKWIYDKQEKRLAEGTVK